jgi:hypothetical protein
MIQQALDTAGVLTVADDQQITALDTAGRGFRFVVGGWCRELIDLRNLRTAFHERRREHRAV